jgi:O-antigen/teichoic acid export membrane protein
VSIFRKLAGQTAVYGLSSILGRLLNYLLVPIYTRVFDTAEYGIVTQFYAYAAFLNVLFTFGLETSFFRFSQTESGNPKVYSTALLSLIGTSVAFFALAWFFADPIAGTFSLAADSGQPLSTYVIWFAGILAADAVTAIPFARLRQQEKAVKFAVIRLLNIGLNIGFNLYFLVYKRDAASYDTSAAVGYVFLSNLLASLITLVILLPELSAVKDGFDRELWSRMMRYGLPLMVAGFAGMVNETFDRIMLPYLVRDSVTALDQLGIYGACYKLSILMTLFVQTFRYAAEPFFFSQSGKEDARQIYARVMNWFVIGCAFIFLVVMLYMDFFSHFIGERFRSGLPVVPILLMANLCLGVYLNISIWYKLSGKTSWGAWFSLAGAIVTLILNFLLIPPLGYLGAAWTTLACYAGMMVASYAVGQRYYKVPYDTGIFIMAVSVAIALWGASAYFDGFVTEQWSRYLVHSLLLPVFPAVVWLFLRRKSLKFA